MSLDSYPDYCISLISEVRRESGEPLWIHPKKGMEYDFELRYASRGKPHLLFLNEKYQDCFPHFVACGCFRILRFFRLPAGERKIAKFPDGRLPKALHEEFTRNCPDAEPEALEEVSRKIRRDVTAQLVSLPMDARVEKEVGEKCAENRALQASYLNHQAAKLIEILGGEKQGRKILPGLVADGLTKMYLAYLLMISPLAGVKHRTRNPLQAEARKLAALEEAVSEGALGDRELSDLWASELEMKWWEWEMLES